MNNHVLLINTSFRENTQSQYSSYGPPMGLLAIAASLQSQGYTVELIDPQTAPDYQDLLSAALKRPPLFVGMSTYLGENIRHAVEFSRRIKNERPELPLVLGGPLASSIPEVFFKQMPVDFIVMGSGEVTVCRLAAALRNSEDPRSLPNISFARGEAVTVGDLYVFEGCLDDVPFPDLALWDKGVRTLGDIPIITSRGCHRGCAFCYNTFTGKRKYYLRSPESVIREMEIWEKRFNIQQFELFDDNFLLDSKRAVAILGEMIRRKWKLSRLFGHLNEFDHLSLDQLANAVTWIVMCIESASPRIQLLLNKRLNLEKALDLIKRITDLKIGFVTAFMFGLPTETDEDIRLSIEMAARIRKLEGSTVSMCYIYAPQPKDAIVKGLGSDQHIDFSLEALSAVEVVPVPPDNKIDLRLRPWLTADDQRFYLDFVQVWQFHFAGYRSPDFDLAEMYARNERVKKLFTDIPAPVLEPNARSKFGEGLDSIKHHIVRLREKISSK